MLANFGKEGRPGPIIAKISQEMSTDMIGTTRTYARLREIGADKDNLPRDFSGMGDAGAAVI